MNHEYVEMKNIYGGNMVYDNEFAKHFTWLNKMILYSPMWASELPSNNVRSKLCTNTIMSFTIILVFLHFGFFVFDSYVITDDAISSIFITVFEILIFIVRNITIYYFYKYFKFPWNNITKTTSNIDQSILFYKRFIILMLFTIFTLNVGWLIGLNYGIYNKIFTDQDTTLHIIRHICVDVFAFIGLLFIYWPLDITLAVSCVIFLKYKYLLDQLNHQLFTFNSCKYKCNKFSDILDEYQILRKEFNIDYNIYLRWSVQIYLLSQICEIWVNLYLFEFDAFWYSALNIAVNIMVVILFAVCGSSVTESFNKFENSIWEYNNKIFKDDNNGKFDYQYALLYLSKYPLKVKLGKITISKESTIVFVVGYAFAKLFAYSLRVFV